MTDSEARSMLNAVIERARKGPLVLEAWGCPACGVDTFMFHKLDESIPCHKCGHRVASKVWLYRFAAKEMADGQ